jgi:hypothetical protein
MDRRRAEDEPADKEEDGERIESEALHVTCMVPPPVTLVLFICRAGYAPVSIPTPRTLVFLPWNLTH